MRITTQLRIISAATAAALIILAPILTWSFIEFKQAKNDYVLADAIKMNFFERAAFQDQYYLYRENRVREQWDKNKEVADKMLRQADAQFHSEEDRQILQRLHRHIEGTAVIFHRIVDNTEVMKTAAGNRLVYEELDKRLFSQLLLKAVAVRDAATTLENASARRIEQSYRHLIIIVGLLAVTLALATILTSMHLIRLIRKRLGPLHDGAKFVADGNLGYRINDGSADEFAELALSINSMTAKLEAEIGAHKQAEEMLRKLSIAVEQSPATVVITDMENNIQYVNPRFTKVTGYSATEIIGQNPRILKSGKMSKEIYQELWAKLTHGKSWHGELLNKRKNGELYWEETHIAPVKNEAGVITHYVAVKTDITERKQIEEALQESERRYHFLFNNNPMPMWVFAEDSLRFLVVNDRAVEHYGYTREEFGRMTLRDIRPLEHGPELDRMISSSPDGKLSGECFHQKKDGTLIDVAISTVPMKYGDIPARIALIQDVTERKQAEQGLKKESEKNLALLRNASDGIHIIDTEGNIIEASDSFCSMLGYQRDEVIGMNVSQWDAQFSDSERTLAIKRQFEYQGRSQFETRHRRKDGTIFDVEVSGFPLELDGKPVLFNSSRDISKRKAAEEKLLRSEANLRAILDNSPYLIWLKDMGGHFIAVNKAFFNTTGLADIQDVLGKTDFDLWPENLAKKYRADDAEVMSTRKQKLTEEMSLDNGEVRWIETFKAPIMDTNGHLLGTTGFAQDITGRKNVEGQIRHLAHYDQLTDLPNRTLFSDRLQQALATAKREKTHLALMFLDLDKFKPINDVLGHHVGDLLLKEAAKRMQDCVRESDTVARIGGDEFVVLLPVIEAAQDAVLVAEKIRHALNRPFVLIGQSLNISSSTGVAVYPEHGKDETQLVKNADIAMYHAKENGRNNVRLYQLNMQESNP